MAQPREVDDLTRDVVAAADGAWQRIQAREAEVHGYLIEARKQPALERLNALRAEVRRFQRDFPDEAQAWAERRVPAAWHTGAFDAAGGRVSADAVWDQQNLTAVTELATTAYRDLLAASEHVGRTSARFARVVRDVARDELAASTLAGRTPADVARVVRRRLEGQGVSAVTYSDGSQHGLSEYTNVVTRTTTAVAYNRGAVGQARALGYRFVEAFDGPQCGLTSHDDPRLAHGMVVAVDEAEQLLIAHPNCRRAWGPRPDLEQVPQAAQDLTGLSDDQLAELLGAVGSDEALVERVVAELDRRDTAGGVNEVEDGPPPDTSAEWAREAAEFNAYRVERPRQRKSGREEAREAWETFQHSAFLRAEDATNGYMINEVGRRAGVDPLGFFDGRYSKPQIRKYGSEELLRWMAEPGNAPQSFTEFAGEYLGWESTRTARREARARGVSEFG